MNEISDPTVAILVEVGQDIPATEMKTLLQRVDIDRYGDSEENKAERIRSRLTGARRAAQDGEIDARRGILAFILEIVERERPNPAKPPRWYDELCAALQGDGYELTGKWEDGGRYMRYTILPTDPAPVPLAEEISALEAELIALGYRTTLIHYKQAVDDFIHHKWESANGNLRTALEDLVTRLAEDRTGYQRLPRAGQGSRAIGHIVAGTAPRLPAGDGGALLDGLWQMTHTNGPHPGLSDADEARFRMQVITATARFLLKRL